MANENNDSCKKDYSGYSARNLISASRAALDEIMKLVEISNQVNGCDIVTDDALAAADTLEADLSLFEMYNDPNQAHLNPERVTQLRHNIEKALGLIDEALCLEPGKIRTYLEEANAARDALTRAQLRTQTTMNDLDTAFNDVEIFIYQQLLKQDICQLDKDISIMRNFHSAFDSMQPQEILPGKPAIDPLSMAVGAISSGATLLLIYVLVVRRNPIISGCLNLGARLGIFRRRDRDIAHPAEVVGLTSSRREVELIQSRFHP
jgi:hypothetical protein